MPAIRLSLEGASASVGALSFVKLPVGYSAAQWKPRFNTQWGRVFLERSVTKRVHPWGLVQHKGENPMKVLISTFAMAIALAITGPAFAGDVSKAKTEADCQKSCDS